LESGHPSETALSLPPPPQSAPEAPPGKVRITGPISEQRYQAAKAESVKLAPNQVSAEGTKFVNLPHPQFIRFEVAAHRGADQARYGELVLQIREIDHKLTDFRTQRERALADHSARSLKEPSLREESRVASRPACFYREQVPDRAFKIKELERQIIELRKEYEKNL